MLLYQLYTGLIAYHIGGKAGAGFHIILGKLALKCFRLSIFRVRSCHVRGGVAAESEVLVVVVSEDSVAVGRAVGEPALPASDWG